MLGGAAVGIAVRAGGAGWLMLAVLFSAALVALAQQTLP